MCKPLLGNCLLILACKLPISSIKILVFNYSRLGAYPAKAGNRLI